MWATLGQRQEGLGLSLSAAPTPLRRLSGSGLSFTLSECALAFPPVGPRSLSLGLGGPAAGHFPTVFPGLAVAHPAPPLVGAGPEDSRQEGGTPVDLSGFSPPKSQPSQNLRGRGGLSSGFVGGCTSQSSAMSRAGIVTQGAGGLPFSFWEPAPD